MRSIVRSFWYPCFSAHSLKGAARTIGLTEIEPICQSLESTFGVLKKQKLVIQPELFDMLKRAVDRLGKLLSSLNDEGKVSGDKSELIQLIDDISTAVTALVK